jgi:hypothetical protein
MTHTVDGWAVQLRCNARCRWKWHAGIEGVKVCKSYLVAQNDAEPYAHRNLTRIVRVRQTTEVIES